jgi:hypothetical protein
VLTLQRSIVEIIGKAATICGTLLPFPVILMIGLAELTFTELQFVRAVLTLESTLNRKTKQAFHVLFAANQMRCGRLLV